MKVKVDFGGEWRVTGGPEKFGCLIFDFGWGFPAKTRRGGPDGSPSLLRASENSAGPYRIFVNEKVNVNARPRLEIPFTFTWDVHEKLDG